MLRIIVVAALAALAFAKGGAAQDGAPYRLEAGDRIAVSVLEDPSLNQTILVRPDGRITFPLAGTIDAAGRTPEAVATALRRALGSDFVEPPTVTVSVVGVSEEVARLPTIYVLGAVASPGPIERELPLDILQALSIAGGPDRFAATDRIQVRRRVDGDEQVMVFDYEMVEDGLVPSQPIALADGDVIVVPERGLFD